MRETGDGLAVGTSAGDELAGPKAEHPSVVGPVVIDRDELLPLALEPGVHCCPNGVEVGTILVIDELLSLVRHNLLVTTVSTNQSVDPQVIRIEAVRRHDDGWMRTCSITATGF